MNNSIEMILDFMSKYNAIVDRHGMVQEPENSAYVHQNSAYVHRRFKLATRRWIYSIENEALNSNWIHLTTKRDHETVKGNDETFYLTYKLWINPKELMTLELDKGKVTWNCFKDLKSYGSYLQNNHGDTMIDSLKDALVYQKMESAIFVNPETDLKVVCKCPNCGVTFFNWLKDGHEMDIETVKMEMETTDCTGCFDLADDESEEESFDAFGVDEARATVSNLEYAMRSGKY